MHGRFVFAALNPRSLLIDLMQTSGSMDACLDESGFTLLVWLSLLACQSITLITVIQTRRARSKPL